ncbi:RNA polymerase sigma factor [Changchengzhania lutea]|uniref:RNA polymerase sigma factor n=1 Tax=Changchengzhania lutea TaxID=2049305 RepID=UPI00115E00BD|nr:RNA polymerase sigma factor [Changchengzhania lutea]
MKSMFEANNIKEEDNILINQALKGDKVALENLIKKHQNWIYNVALAMVSDHNDAADITQEVLIKCITKLGTFKNESNFRTWLYRIVKNHFLNMKRGKYETKPMSFDEFGEGLDTIPNESLSNYIYKIDKNILIEEAKISCMKGMLLCLDREQRFIYIIGELFEFSDTIGSTVMEITKANFRVKLHRAKQQLYNFMNDKCGLVNKKNPCRCARKTTGFIEKGYVDPINLHFQKERITTIGKVANKKANAYDNEVINDYQQLFHNHPFVQSPDNLKSIKKLLSSKSIKDTFNLD